jgi:hypothetical protein
MMLCTQASAPRLCRDDAQESLRRCVLIEIDWQLKNLKMCVHWLVEEGVSVQAVDMKRGADHPEITVAASPWLFVLFKDSYTFAGQYPVDAQRPAAGMVHHWLAIRHDCLIRWEEVMPCAA